jgi:hypothetical protein
MTQTDQLIPSVLIALGGLVGNFFLIRQTTRIPEKAPSSSREESTAAAEARAAEERAAAAAETPARREIRALDDEVKVVGVEVTPPTAKAIPDDVDIFMDETKEEVPAAEERGAEETKAADVATRVESDVDPFKPWNTDVEFEEFPEDVGTRDPSEGARLTPQIDDELAASSKPAQAPAAAAEERGVKETKAAATAARSSTAAADAAAVAAALAAERAATKIRSIIANKALDALNEKNAPAPPSNKVSDWRQTLINNKYQDALREIRRRQRDKNMRQRR